MTWLLVPLIVYIVVLALYAHAGYTMGYDSGYRDRMLGEPHRDDRPSWWRRFLDMTHRA